MCSRNTRRSRTVQRHNDKCHIRWHKLPPILWRVFAGNHALMLWEVVWFWLNREQDNKGLMTLEKKTKRQLRQPRIWWTPYPWMDFHRHFLLSGFRYSLGSLYCIYQLGNCCQHRGVYHDALIDCKNWHLWSYWWLVVKKHHTVKIWQTQEPSLNATEGQQKCYSW